MDNLNNTNYKSREEKRKYEEELIKRKSQTEKEMAKNRAEIQKILFNDENERKNKKEVKKTKKTIITNIWLALTLLLAIAFALYLGYHSLNSVNQIYELINGGLILIIVICFIIAYNRSLKKNKTTATAITGALFMGFMSFNCLYLANFIELPVQSNIPNFVGQEYTTALAWNEENDVTFDQTFDYSDTVSKYSVISQSTEPQTLTKNINEVSYSVSNGPDYNKNVIISDMTGWSIDEVLKVIDKNFLNNVIVNFEENPDIERNTVISQSISGNIKRNDEITFTVSLGDKNALSPIKLKNLKDEKLLNASVYLGQNAITYELNYEFSNDVAKGNVISTDSKQGTTLNPDDHVTLTVSKGKEIKVPDLTNKTMYEITEWMIENNLQINYSDRYDNKIKSGRVIETNYKEGDIIEEGTTVDVVFSKGKLKMPKVTDIDSFKSWADTNGVKYEIIEEFNNDVAQGDIIKTTVETGKVINLDETITVYISKGEAVTVPNFNGQTKNDAQKQCDSLGLTCTFTEQYSTKTEGTVIDQSIASGTEVSKGDNITITIASSDKKAVAGTNNNSSKNTSSSSSPGSSSNSSNNSNSNNTSNGGGTNNNVTVTNKTFSNIFIQTSWLTSTTPSTNCNTITSKIQKQTSNRVNITCKYESSSEGRSVGKIHESSPYQANRSYSFTEGQTYTFILVE